MIVQRGSLACTIRSLEHFTCLLLKISGENGFSYLQNVWIWEPEPGQDSRTFLSKDVKVHGLGCVVGCVMGVMEKFSLADELRKDESSPSSQSALLLKGVKREGERRYP